MHFCTMTWYLIKTISLVIRKSFKLYVTFVIFLFLFYQQIFVEDLIFCLIYEFDFMVKELYCCND